jgi:SAM-dependent methyltransferase
MSTVDPEPLTRAIGQLLAVKHLLVADAVDLFPALAAGPATLDELAGRTGLPRRTLRILADSLVAQGFAARDGDRYRNGPVAAAFLTGDPAVGWRAILRLWDRIVYPQHLHLEGALRADRATGGFGTFTGAERRIFAAGVEALTAPAARALAETYDFAPHRRLLDLGGGTGSFLRAVLERSPHLDGALYELPAAAAAARERAGGAAGSGRFEIVEGDFLRDPLPGGYDAVLLANVVHLFRPDTNRGLFRRLRAAVTPPARLLLVDFWTNPEHTVPRFAALLAGEFQLVTGEGDVYSADEASGWLADGGWRPVEHRPLAGPASLLVADAVDDAGDGAATDAADDAADPPCIRAGA